jgi:ketosteroid isomerase-like protein
MVKPFLLASLMLALGTGTAFAQADDQALSAGEEAVMELLTLNQVYDDALIAGDIATLGELYADDFTYTSTAGEVLDKAQQLELFRSGKLKIESGVSESVKIRVYGDTGVVTGFFRSQGQLEGQPFNSSERFLSVWVKDGTQWQLVAEQATEVPLD